MTFDHPDLLGLALALPALVTLGVWGYVRRRRRALAALGDPAVVARLGAAGLDRFAAGRLALVAIAGAALGLAAAGPRWGLVAVQEERRALDLVLAMDVSRSMLATDVEPSRLERARVLARRLLRELPGDRIGLVAFAGRAYVLSPLTIDHGALGLYLDALGPEIVSQGGSSLAAALRQAGDLARQPGEGVPGTVVLVTDGEALEERSAVESAARRARQLGVTVHAVGVGTPAGAPVPERDPITEEATGYMRGPDGEIVISRLEEGLLRSVTERTGGRYVRMGRPGATEGLLAALRGLEREQVRGEERIERRARYGWFLALALALLAVDAVLARRAAARDTRVPRRYGFEEASGETA